MQNMTLAFSSIPKFDLFGFIVDKYPSFMEVIISLRVTLFYGYINRLELGGALKLL